MTDKEKLKKDMHRRIDDVIESMDIINKLDYFEVTLRHTNGEIFYRPSFTIIDKVNK